MALHFLEPEEFVIGFYETSKTIADALYQLLKDVQMRFSLPMLCYNDASNMSGVKAGLQTCVLEQESRAQYIHCTAHLVNLVVHDVAQNIPACRNFMALITLDNPDQKFTKAAHLVPRLSRQ